jgi:hypothetical protein
MNPFGQRCSEAFLTMRKSTSKLLESHFAYIRERDFHHVRHRPSAPRASQLGRLLRALLSIKETKVSAFHEGRVLVGRHWPTLTTL